MRLQVCGAGTWVPELRVRVQEVEADVADECGARDGTPAAGDAVVVLVVGPTAVHGGPVAGNGQERGELAVQEEGVEEFELVGEGAVEGAVAAPVVVLGEVGEAAGVGAGGSGEVGGSKSAIVLGTACEVRGSVSVWKRGRTFDASGICSGDLAGYIERDDDVFVIENRKFLVVFLALGAGELVDGFDKGVGKVCEPLRLAGLVSWIEVRFLLVL